MITPEQLAKSGTEDGNQAALFCWIAIHINDYPDLCWAFAIPNGGWRDPATANKLKATGVKRGVPDVFLPVNRGKFSGLFIEIKRPASVGKAKGRISDDQKEWKQFLLSQGFGCIVAYGWEEARDYLVQYLEHK